MKWNLKNVKGTAVLHLNSVIEGGDIIHKSDISISWGILSGKYADTDGWTLIHQNVVEAVGHLCPAAQGPSVCLQSAQID